MSTEKKAKIYFYLIEIILALGSLLALFFSLAPFDVNQLVFNRLTPDGSLEFFTEDLFQQLKIIVLVTGLILGMGTLWGLQQRNHLTAAIQKKLNSQILATLRSDWRQLLQDAKPSSNEKFHLLTLLIITMLGFAIRLWIINRPVQHDEAYSFIAFASRPLKYLLMDYHLPNNHIFQNLLVYISYHMFGNQPWIMRLPVLLFGIVITPITYFTSKALYNRDAGLIAAGLVASAYPLIDYSTNARGYILICTFTLVIIGLAAYLHKNKNQAAWLLLIIFSTLGFYTMPIMLYPFGIVNVWLLLCAFFENRQHKDRIHLIKSLLGAAVITTILVMILYTPVFYYSGLSAITRNGFVAPLSWNGFLESILGRMQRVVEVWSADVPNMIFYSSVLGFFIALIFHKKISKQRLSIILAVTIWMTIVLSLQRVAPWPRVWLFLLPLYLIAASAGVVAVLKKIIPSKMLVPLVMVLALLTPALRYSNRQQWANHHPGEISNIEQATLFLQDHLEPDDLVIASTPVRIIFEYYFKLHDIPVIYLPPKDTDTLQEGQRIVVALHTGYQSTIENVLDKRAVLLQADLDTAVQIYDQRNIQIYRISSK